MTGSSKKHLVKMFIKVNQVLSEIYEKKKLTVKHQNYL